MTLATGGTVTNEVIDGKVYRRHEFTDDGTFEVVYAISKVEVWAVGGGGAGGPGAEVVDGRAAGGGGGGGGGVHLTDVTPSVGSSAVNIGAGGAIHPTGSGNGGNGGDTTVSAGAIGAITALGGGGGAGGSLDLLAGSPGGSGGGGGYHRLTVSPFTQSPGTGGAGTEGQGFDGADGDASIGARRSGPGGSPVKSPELPTFEGAPGKTIERLGVFGHGRGGNAQSTMSFAGGFNGVAASGRGGGGGGGAPSSQEGSAAGTGREGNDGAVVIRYEVQVPPEDHIQLPDTQVRPNAPTVVALLPEQDPVVYNTVLSIDPELPDLLGLVEFTGGATDISQLVQSVSIRRGRPDDQSRFAVGTAQLTLRNDGGWFDPDAVTAIVLRGPISIGWTDPQDQVHDLFVGVVEDIDVRYELSGTSTVTVSAVDRMALLAGQTIEDRTFPAETSGDRVAAVLGLPEVDYPGPVDIDGGVQTVAAQADVGGNVLDYLQAVVTNTELGTLLVDRHGTLIFRQRDAALNVIPDLILSDAADTRIGYRAIERVVGVRNLYNRVRAVLTDETVVVADDAESQATFGVRTLDLGELPVASEVDGQALVDFILLRRLVPATEFTSVQVIVDDYDDDVRADLLDLDLTDQITVRFRPPGADPLAVQCTIRQIEHAVSVGSPWRTTFQLTAADPRPFLVYAGEEPVGNDTWDDNMWSL